MGVCLAKYNQNRLMKKVSHYRKESDRGQLPAVGVSESHFVSTVFVFSVR
jgi:hypothetical protein